MIPYQTGNAFLEVGDSKLLFFKNEFYALFIFFKNQAVTFLCYDLPCLKHVIKHNIEFSCCNHAERVRFEHVRAHCLSLTGQMKIQYSQWNARLLFSLPSTGIRTVFPLCLPSSSLDISLGKFAERLKSLLRSLEMSPPQPFFGMSRNDGTCVSYQYSLTLSRNLNFF